MAGNCTTELSKVQSMIGCPNANDLVMLIKSDKTVPLLLPFGQLLACIAGPRDLYLTVGVDAGTPADGATSWQRADFAGYHLDITINKIPQFLVLSNAPPADGVYYSKAFESDTVNFFGMQLNTGDIIHVRMFIGAQDLAPQYIIGEGGAQIQSEDGTQDFNTQ